MRLRGRLPTSFRGLVAGTVLRDYSAPSTGKELAETRTQGDALAVYLEACERKSGASAGTKRKWRRMIQRRLA